MSSPARVAPRWRVVVEPESSCRGSTLVHPLVADAPTSPSRSLAVSRPHVASCAGRRRRPVARRQALLVPAPPRCGHHHAQAPSGGSWSEPRAACRCGDRAMQDVGPLVVTGFDRVGVLESVDGPLELVASPVTLAVAVGSSAARAAPVPAGGPLALRLGDRVLDAPSSQVAAVAVGAVSLVAADMVGPGPGPPTSGREPAFGGGTPPT